MTPMLVFFLNFRRSEAYEHSRDRMRIMYNNESVAFFRYF